MRFLSLFLLAGSFLQAQSDRPNFVILFADDLGYGDLSIYGSQNIRTPNIDRMAFEGVKLTEFYSASPVCTPSRAGLLTGRYPVRSGMVRVLFPREEVGLPAEEITLAEALKEVGYRTGIVGKWHLGDRPRFSPLRNGFDYRYGLPFSNDMTRPHTNWPEPLRLYEMDDVVEEGVEQRAITKKYTEKAVAFIEKNKQEPFFLYVPYTMPHWPWYASAEFEGKSLKGVYGDAIEEIDWSVGQILATLKRLGLDENTLVVFTSDNGGTGREGGGNNGSLRGYKGQTYEGGIREPFVARWPDRISAQTIRHGIAGTIDLMPTLVKLAGGRMPADRPVDGLDIWPLLASEGESPRKEYYYWSHNWESEPQLAAVREGRWKLHFKEHYDWPQTKFEPSELYDLHSDPAEKFDQLKAHPDIVKKLTEKARSFHASIEFGKLPPTHYPPGAPDRPYSGGIRSQLRSEN